MITLDTHINSPRLIAGGTGAWEGTLGNLVAVDGEKVTDYVMRNHELDDQPSTEEIAALITVDDLKDILDDPNVEMQA